MTYEKVEREFQRQVRLCSGIGPIHQLEIMVAFWERDRAFFHNHAEKAFFAKLKEFHDGNHERAT